MFSEKDQSAINNENATQSETLENTVMTNTDSIDTTNSSKKSQDNLLYDNMIFPS